MSDILVYIWYRTNYCENWN